MSASGNGVLLAATDDLGLGCPLLAADAWLCCAAVPNWLFALQTHDLRCVCVRLGLWCLHFFGPAAALACKQAGSRSIAAATIQATSGRSAGCLGHGPRAWRDHMTTLASRRAQNPAMPRRPSVSACFSPVFRVASVKESHLLKLRFLFFLFSLSLLLFFNKQRARHGNDNPPVLRGSLHLHDRRHRLYRFMIVFCCCPCCCFAALRHPFSFCHVVLAGKVVLEKMLRSCPEMQNIYVLVRPSKKESPQERIKVLELRRKKQKVAGDEKKEGRKRPAPTDNYYLFVFKPRMRACLWLSRRCWTLKCMTECARSSPRRSARCVIFFVLFANLSLTVAPPSLLLLLPTCSNDFRFFFFSRWFRSAEICVSRGWASARRTGTCSRPK